MTKCALHDVTPNLNPNQFGNHPCLSTNHFLINTVSLLYSNAFLKAPKGRDRLVLDKVHSSDKYVWIRFCPSGVYHDATKDFPYIFCSP